MQGSNPRGPIDFSNYAYLNLDVWVPAYAGDYTLGVALLTSNEVKVDYTIDGGPAGWRTLTIPISDFANSEISSVDGIKFEPNPQGSIPIFIGTIYLLGVVQVITQTQFQSMQV